MAIHWIYWGHLSLGLRGPVEIMYITCIYYVLVGFEMHFLPTSLAAVQWLSQLIGINRQARGIGLITVV